MVFTNTGEYAGLAGLLGCGGVSQQAGSGSDRATADALSTCPRGSLCFRRRAVLSALAGALRPGCPRAQRERGHPPHTPPPASPLWEPLAERMHPGRALGEGRPRLLRGDCSREDHPKCPSDVKRGVQVDQAQKAEPSGSAALGAGRAGAPRCRAQQAEPPDLPQQVPSLQPLQRGVSIHPSAGSSQLALVFSCAAT